METYIFRYQTQQLKNRYQICIDLDLYFHLKFIQSISKAFFVHLYSFHLLISIHE